MPRLPPYPNRPDAIVNLKDYLGADGKPTKKVTLLEGQVPCTVATLKAHLAGCRGSDNKVKAIKDMLDCYFSHHNVPAMGLGVYGDEALKFYEDLGCAIEPWKAADGSDHTAFLGVRNHKGLGKKQASLDAQSQKQHDDKNLSLAKDERNALVSGAAPSMEPISTYMFQQKRKALKVARSKGLPTPYNDEIWDEAYLEPVPCGRVTDRGRFTCDSCRRDMMDGAKKDPKRGADVGNVLNEHDHWNGRRRENDICPFCNQGPRKTTDDVKRKVDKKAMRQFGPCLLVALGGRKVAAATSADRDLVARALKAAAAAASAYDRHWADALAEESQRERRETGVVSQRGARRAARGVAEGDGNAEESASELDGASEGGAASASLSPPRRSSDAPQPLSPGSATSARSTGSVSSAAAGRARLRAAKKRSRRSSAEFAASVKRRRSPSDAADDAARDFVTQNLGRLVELQSAMREFRAAPLSGSFLANDAAAVIASLDAFLEKSQQS